MSNILKLVLKYNEETKYGLFHSHSTIELCSSNLQRFQMVYAMVPILKLLCLIHIVTCWGHSMDGLDDFLIITVVFVYFVSS